MTKFDSPTKKELAVARKRFREDDQRFPRALSAWYDPVHDVVTIMLKRSGIVIPRSSLQGLADAAPEQLHDIAIDANGKELVFPQLDLHFGISGLIEGRFGGETWVRALLAREAGKAKSAAKTAAARANGAKGGRPPKKHAYQYAS